MPPVDLRYDTLKSEYQKLWDTCTVSPRAKPYVTKAMTKIKALKPTYEALSAKSSIPWWFIAVIHYMECGLRMAHLHNGDPLATLTTHVPKDRPIIYVDGVRKTKYFTFEESALDALKSYSSNKDWSITKVLYMLESYNGFGYRQYHANTLTPYLWSFTNHYTKGKYVADGHFDPNAVSQQLGLVCLLKELYESS